MAARPRRRLVARRYLNLERGAATSAAIPSGSFPRRERTGPPGPASPRLGGGGSSGPWTAGRVPPVDMVVVSAPCPVRRSILASCAIPAGEIKLSGCSLLLDFFSIFFFLRV